MEFGLYLLYGFIQAVLVSRYGIENKYKDGSIVFGVCLMMIFAPFVTFGLLCAAFYFMVMWLVTYKSKNETKY